MNNRKNKAAASHKMNGQGLEDKDKTVKHFMYGESEDKDLVSIEEREVRFGRIAEEKNGDRRSDLVSGMNNPWPKAILEAAFRQ